MSGGRTFGLNVGFQGRSCLSPGSSFPAKNHQSPRSQRKPKDPRSVAPAKATMAATLSLRRPFLRVAERLDRRGILCLALVSRIVLWIAMVLSNKLIPTPDPGSDVLQVNLQEESPVYRTLLTPLTRWDSARFLTIAASPEVRIPIVSQDYLCYVGSSRAECDEPFLQSEQAHAFFPLFPTIVRRIAQHLQEHAPQSILPSTFEGTIALSALLWNMLCCVLATAALWDLTHSLVKTSGISPRIQWSRRELVKMRPNSSC